MNEKVLCVDDDTNILAGYKRQLRKLFALETASSGQEGLDMIGQRGPFQVIVSDMRMPGMDGIQFLKHVKQWDPDAVRIMLTGNADLQTAVNAVNEGNIFRFLTKPCPPESLATALNAGIRQHQLIIAERVLLRDTLTGALKILTDMISLLNPLAFGRASRVRRYVRHIAAQLELTNQWELEVAGMLSQIGCVTLPRGVLEKVYKHEILSPDEQKMFAQHPQVARKLLENIPRLKMVSRMIGRQHEAYSAQMANNAEGQTDPIELGAQILKVAVDLDELIAPGLAFTNAWRKLTARMGQYNPDVLDALMTLSAKQPEQEIRQLGISDLRIGMVAHEGICGKDGSLLVPNGQEITYPVLVLLRNAAQKKGVVEPIAVQVGAWVDEGECPSVTDEPQDAPEEQASPTPA
ncbi:MAG: response regulator [Phycisphaerae bacterium]|nr:response regulator [Phycisphaerae bacterium]